MHSRSKSPVPGKKRSSTRLCLPHGGSRCAPLWSSPRAKVVSTGSCEASRDRGWEAPLPAGVNIFPGFTKPIFCRAVEWLIDRDDFSGPVNLASPNQIQQREMMRIIRRELGVPFGLPATRRMLEVAAFVHRTEAELIIKSRRVAPGRLLEAGFQFLFPRMEDAVRENESRL